MCDFEITLPMATKINPTDENWFDHPIEVFPNNTDYGNIVWHGTYLIWMEEARVKCLSSIGVNFADFVASGVDMPVVEIKSLKYFHPLRLGYGVYTSQFIIKRDVKSVGRYGKPDSHTCRAN
jgi:acyl-CoA thioester hydrolase